MGTKPRTSHHQSPGAERHGKRKHWTIFLKGREMVIRNQMNIGTISKAMLGKLLRDGVEHYLGFSECMDTILN